jgi:hypothetical protein
MISRPVMKSLTIALFRFFLWLANRMNQTIKKSDHHRQQQPAAAAAARISNARVARSRTVSRQLIVAVALGQ